MFAFYENWLLLEIEKKLLQTRVLENPTPIGASM